LIIEESTARGLLVWFTSSYSNGAGGECVECASTVQGALIRDSKSTRGPIVTVGDAAWSSFVRAVAHGKLACDG
jgi:hypothetical protein